MIQNAIPLSMHAVFTGCIAVSMWPSDEIALAIPPALSLQQSPADDGRCPLLFLFGEQNWGSWQVGRARPSSPLRYNELLVVAPNLRDQRDQLAVGVVLGGYCNYVPAAAVGKSIYGYAKQSVDLGWDGTCYRVCDPGSSWSANVNAYIGPTQDVVNRLQNLANINIYGVRTDGVAVLSRWQLDFAHARRRLAHATFDCPTGFLGQTHWLAEGLLLDNVPWSLTSAFGP